MPREIHLSPDISGKRESRVLDAAIAGLAERQQGVVARRQLAEIGLREHEVDYLIATSRLHRLHRSVYAVGHRRITQEAHWLAAVLAAGDDAVLSHRSAAEAWALLPL